MRMKRLLKIGLLILLIVVLADLFVQLPSDATQSDGVPIRHATVWEVYTKQKVVALTFDDGPRPPYTTEILSILHDAHIKATFFVIGENAARYKELVKETLDAGHQVGNHSWTHSEPILRHEDLALQEIERTDKLLRSLGVKGYIEFRAPYGETPPGLKKALATLGRRDVLFDVNPNDWENPPPGEIAARVLRRTRPGSIIDLHDGGGIRRNTVAATPMIIEGLLKEGYRFVTVEELLQLK